MFQKLLAWSPGFLICGLLLLFCYTKNHFYLLLGLAAILQMIALNPLYKCAAWAAGVRSPRPDTPTSNGMPSGHVSTFSCVLGLCLLFKDKVSAGWILLLGVWTALVAWQRISSGRHTVPQVCGGVTQGAFDASWITALCVSMLVV